jgi:SulP family sulfate permease
MKLLRWHPIAAGDAWGGLAAMLVAFPAAIAFGVTVYATIGPNYAAMGALAGIVGATVIGLVAASLGGTERLISAPCAPAAAVLSAFAIELVHSGSSPNLIVLLLMLVGLLAGVIQLAMGWLGVGRLIKYIPFPVVSGYLSGVGLIIIGSQIPKFAGVPDGMSWWQGLISPALWDWRAMVIGAVTAAVAVLAPRVTQRIPGIILGIVAGLLTYLMLALQNPALRVLADNHLVIGPLGVSSDGHWVTLMERWVDIRHMAWHHVASVLGTALTLGVLLSIDTLKTCVVLDQLTRSRHDSDRELVAQGLANLAANAVGGISGAGQMGATLVGLNSGSTTRTAGVLEGAFALLAALLLSAFIAWIPVATLAGILMVIGVRMIDRESLKYLRSKRTLLDFCVVVSVVLVALTVGLIAASAVGVAMAILLFVREQIGGVVIRHKMELGQTSSSWHRPAREIAILEAKGDSAVVFELQGSLFFGNTYQLYTDLEQEISTRSYVIIDFRRVRSIDITAAHLFKQIRATIKERGATLVLSGVREDQSRGSNLHEFLWHTGLWHPQSKTVRILPDLDAAIAWVEDRLLGESEYAVTDEAPMKLQEMEIFCAYTDNTLKDLEASMTIHRFVAGQVIYVKGSSGDDLYWVRQGAVRLVASLKAGKTKPVASFGRGDFFGGLAFLDNQPRPNDAIAVTDTEVYALSRQQFHEIAAHHKRLAFNIAMAMAQLLAKRLRQTETKLSALQES